MLIRDLKKIFFDKATYQRISEHIANKNDIITNEDLANIKTNWNNNYVEPNREIHNTKAVLHT